MDINTVSQDALGIITKAELDIAVTTAKAYPRDLKRFLDKTIMDVTLSQSIAEKCSYSVPRGGKNVEGPSVHLARICCANYQNLKVAVRIIANDGKTVTAQGICIDMENNYTASIEVKKKITDRYGNTFSEDMQIVTSNAACAIAFRNAVFQVVPSAFVTEIQEKAKEVAKGTIQDLETRRANCIAWFAGQGVTEKQVLDLAGVFSIADIGLDELFSLKSIQNSLVSGEQTIHSLFETNINPEAKESVSDMANKAYGADENSVEKPKGNRANNPKQ